MMMAIRRLFSLVIRMFFVCLFIFVSFSTSTYLVSRVEEGKTQKLSLIHPFPSLFLCLCLLVTIKEKSYCSFFSAPPLSILPLFSFFFYFCRDTQKRLKIYFFPPQQRYFTRIYIYMGLPLFFLFFPMNVSLTKYHRYTFFLLFIFAFFRIYLSTLTIYYTDM